MFEYVGALHMHSIFSDGSGRVEEIAAFAKETGLDFIILTDHNTLRALKEGYEKWYGHTMLLVGCEINDKKNENHYLAFGIDQTYSTRLSAKEYVKKIKEAGGIGFLAHPHEKRHHMKEHPAYPWTEWDTDDYNGIEIWNHMSEWMENLTEQNKYQAFLHPLKTITAPNADTLKIWDEQNLRRPVPGIGGVDAHAHKYNLLGFLEVEIFPYKVLFKSIRTHILIDEEIKKSRDPKSFQTSKQLIYDALKNGNCFIANDYHADAKGFRFTAETKRRKYIMGQSIETPDKVTLKVSVPSDKGEINLVRNGKTIDTLQHHEAEFVVNRKGAYRVEVYINDKAWIFSNHIRINL